MGILRDIQEARPWRRFACEGREREKVTEGCSGGPGRPEMKARVRMGGSREGRQQGRAAERVFSFCL